MLRQHARSVVAMTASSAAGTVAGGLPLGTVPTAVIEPLIVVLLILSAAKVWRHV